MFGDGFLSIFKTRAVVLKTQDFKENDKLIWLFSEKLGKISTIAHGAKKGKSKFLPLTIPFSYGDYVLYKGKSLYTINEGELIESFQIFLDDLNVLTYVSYLNELIDIALIEGESNRELFKQFVSTYYLIKNKVCDIEILLRAFEVKLLELTGYGLNLDYCVYCRKKINTSNYISFQYPGGVCDECTKVNGMKVSNESYNILRYLTKTSIYNVNRLIISNDAKDELYKILSVIIENSYFKKPKSLKLIDYLKGSDENE